MGLLDFIEQDHRIGPAADCFRQHTAFAVTDVSGRRTLQSGHGMRFLKLRHVDGDDVLLTAVKQVGERQRGFGLTDATGSHQQERSHRLVGIVERGARGADALGDSGDSEILPDNAFVHVIFEIQHDADLILHHFADGDSGPAGDHFADNLLIDTHSNERSFTLHRLKVGIEFGKLFLEGDAVGGGGSGGVRFFQFAANFADLVDQREFLLVACLQTGEPLFGGLLLRAEFRQSFAVIGSQRDFALQYASLDGDVVEGAVRVFDGRRHGVLAEGKAGASGVENADRLIGQLAIGQIAIRKFDGGSETFVEDAHVVVLLEDRDESAEHQFALLLAGLFHLDELEAAGEGRVLLEILLVFRPRSGGNRTQFAARQGGLQQVGRIALPLRATGADHGMGFVDEENDRCGRRLHFVDQTLQAILKFALDARAGLQEREVEGVELNFLEWLRHVARSDAEREPFHHSGLADTGPRPRGWGCSGGGGVRMSTTWRISKSRPSTGSICPCARSP